MIRAGLTGDPLPKVADDEHPIVARVLELFGRLEGYDVDSQREASMVLARVAAAGGAPAVNAVRELRSIFAEIDRMVDGDSFGDMLSVPTAGSVE